MTKKTVCYYMVAGLLAMQACKIENDIPYPIVEGNIESFEVEGQCTAPGGTGSAAQINTSGRTVTLYVDDTVDLTKLRITRFTVSSDAEIQADSAACVDYAKFPTAGFEEPANSADTRMDFSDPVKFTLSTYQDYRWTVSVTQIIDRKVDVTGMIRSVVDPENRTAIVYVSPETDLSNLTVNAMNLGGASGTVTPDPTAIHDYSKALTFQVSHGWEETAHEWKVYVYHSEEDASSAELFPRTTSATLRGTVRSGQTVAVEYKEAGASNWSSVSDVQVDGTDFTAQITGLTGGTSYSYRVNVDGMEGEEQTFTTAQAQQLTNGGLDDWWSETTSGGRLMWYPEAEGSSAYWSTGNKGATTIANSNTEPTLETCNGSGRAALLQTKWLTMKLAAGNLFTGDFEVDGTHGVLTLGREFTSFPSALRMHLKYKTSTINHASPDKTDWDHMIGQSDTCHIYFALTTEKVVIRTRTFDVFDRRAPEVVAYGEYQSGTDVSGTEQNGYLQVDAPFEYYRTDVTPKYVIIVCSASKYGNYFTGGDASQLWLDNLEMVYE